MLFSWVNLPKSQRKLKAKKSDVMSEQVKKILQSVDQRLILMVRG